MKKSEKGFIPVMLTPFKGNGTVDLEALATLTNYYIRNGASGLFANGQSGEMFELDPAERLQVIEQVVRISDGRVPVIAAGNFGADIEAQADFVKQVYARGVAAVVLLTNQLAAAGETEAMLESNIMKLLDLTGTIPVGFYECPVPYKIILSPELFGRLMQTGRVAYHIGTPPDIKTGRGKSRSNTDAGLDLYEAYRLVPAATSPQPGAAGLSCIQGNYFPELVAWFCKNYDNSALKKEVNLVHRFFREEMEVMYKDYPKAAKYYLWKKGMNISVFTRNSGDSQVSYEMKNNIDQLERRYLNLMEQISGMVVCK